MVYDLKTILNYKKIYGQCFFNTFKMSTFKNKNKLKLKLHFLFFLLLFDLLLSFLIFK